jgi:hypothetical protein
MEDARAETAGGQRGHIVYGKSDQGFCVIPYQDALNIAADLAKLRSCKTLGDLRVLANSLVHGPPMDLGELEFEDDDDPFDWRNCESLPSTTLACVDWLARDDDLFEELHEQAGARYEENLPDGPLIRLPEDKEAELVSVLEAHGYKVTRDDSLV